MQHHVKACNTVLHGVLGCYIQVHTVFRVTECYTVLKGPTRCDLVLHSVTRRYIVLHLVIYSVTWCQ